MRTLGSVTVAGLVALLACEHPTESASPAGNLSLQVVSEGGSAVVLDSGFVRLDGPTDRTVKVTPGATVTIEGLSPGSYTVALEGFDDDAVDRFGQTSGVQVIAGQNTTASVNLTSFVPVLNPLPPSGTSTTFAVQFSSVVGATSYEVETATDAAFTAGRQAFPTTATSLNVTVADFGTRFVRVRGIDPFQLRGRPSPSQSIVLAPPRGALFLIRDSDDTFQRLDPETLEITDLGPLGIDFAFGDCAWRPANSTLYMVENRPTTNLYRVNLTTGAATLIGPHGIADVRAIGYHPPTDALYGVSAAGDFYRFDLNTGAPTFIGATGAGESIDGLAFEDASGRFVAAGANLSGSHVFEINVATGAATQLANTPGINNHGLAYDPVILRFWLADYDGNLHQYDPGSLFARTTLATDLGQHTCITFVP
jgi:hypothetical protein